ncbi:speckle-type POZ protein B-like [Belonocnema kinseyi]|uniref:speckle-type POZ protein B-like n=1 Tax=Belonocnema kinseyi TaxID=2817044 RepID=UPI00143D2D43|nr:speckle-type POZ protein B-like [Belonocnema kinseyi]XP_033218015.1 speckle-type POZ protein B-like [Belonocnema kinseyi]
MEYSTVSYPSDRSDQCDKRHGLTIPFMMHDFKTVIRSGKETRLQRRVLSFSENPTIQCSIDIDFTGENLNAQIQYFTTELPRRSYEMVCTLADISDLKSGKKISLYHEFHHENLWLSVVRDWRPLCSFPCILPKVDLYDFIQSDFRFLLMFKFIEGEYVEVQPTLKTLSSLFENETFADFTIVARGKEFKVHRAVLATASAVFEAMFLSQMKEQQENQMSIDDIEPDVIKEMLRFVYTGAVHNIKDHAEKLLIAADKYRLENLKGFCGRQLSKSIDAENVMNVLILADTYRDSTLRQSALKFINKNLKAILQKDDNVDVLTSRPDFAVEILLNIA